MARPGRPKKNSDNIENSLETKVTKKSKVKKDDKSIDAKIKEAQNSEKKEYFIVDKRILPSSIKNVLLVNDLVQNEKLSKYEAIKKVGLSRSTYYKYKDYIKPFFEGGQEIGRAHV